jgi:acetyl-CoA acetyltransferase
MHEFGTRPEQLGAIALAMRRHAQLNDNAVMQGKEMTLEAYLASPMLSDPYKLFDCCLETDGAAACVVTSVERARDLRARPVTIMGAAAGQPYPPTKSRIARISFGPASRSPLPRPSRQPV